jgi:hypothetical protein
MAEYRPSKTAWFWSCVASVVLTMVIGFAFGGWVTGGTAESMAALARQDAREQLVASICVERFVSAPDAAQKLQELKEARSWERDGLIEDEGWATVNALDEQVSGAADLCAERLVALESVPPQALDPSATANDDTTAGG